MLILSDTLILSQDSTTCIVETAERSRANWLQPRIPLFSRTSSISYKILTPQEEHNHRRLINNLQKLNRIANYTANWNGYGAQPLPAKLIEKTTQAIQSFSIQPELFPTSNDSIQVEWEKPNGEYLEIQISLSDQWDTFHVNTDGHSSDAVIPADVSIVNNLVQKFYANTLQ